MRPRYRGPRHTSHHIRCGPVLKRNPRRQALVAVADGEGHGLRVGRGRVVLDEGADGRGLGVGGSPGEVREVEALDGLLVEDVSGVGGGVVEAGDLGGGEGGVVDAEVVDVAGVSPYTLFSSKLCGLSLIVESITMVGFSRNLRNPIKTQL